MKTLLLGLGNDLLTDDAIGLRVAAALREQLSERENLTIAETAEMGLALLDLVAGFDNLLVVDAVETGQAPPGFVHELEGAELKLRTSVAPHFLGLAETLELGRELGLPMPGSVRVFAVEVQDPYTLGTRMTPALEAALPAIISQLETRWAAVRTGQETTENRAAR